MRKHLAVFGLFVRSSLLRILILLGGMILLQAFLFGYTMHTTFSSENLVWGLESIITDSRIVFVFALAFLLMTLQLASVGCSHSSQTGYTLSRLCVTPQTVFLWQAAANTLFYLLLWAAEASTVFAFTQYYAAAVDPSQLSNQTVFLAYYRSTLLHGLMPLDQISIYIRNIVLICGLGTAAAVFPFRQRKKSIGLELYVLVPLVCIMFPRQTSEMVGDVFLILLSAFLMFTALYSVFTKEDANSES